MAGYRGLLLSEHSFPMLETFVQMGFIFLLYHDKAIVVNTGTQKPMRMDAGSHIMNPRACPKRFLCTIEV